jgi:hypothetical protein
VCNQGRFHLVGVGELFVLGVCFAGGGSEF